MRQIVFLIFMMLPGFANAQMRDNVFKDYASFSQFVDEKVMARDFTSLILALGGRDEYTPEQLASLNRQLLDVFPKDFEHATVFRQVDLGGNFNQEARAFWVGENYVFFYAILHQREDGLVVINFSLNSSVGKIMSKF